VNRQTNVPNWFGISQQALNSSQQEEEQKRTVMTPIFAGLESHNKSNADETM